MSPSQTDASPNATERATELAASIEAALSRKQTREARERIRELAAIDPGKAEKYSSRATLLEKSLQREERRARAVALEREIRDQIEALHLDGADAKLSELRNLDRAKAKRLIAPLKKASRFAKRRDEAERLLVAARTALGAGRVDEAKATLRKIDSLFPRWRRAAPGRGFLNIVGASDVPDTKVAGIFSTRPDPFVDVVQGGRLVGRTAVRKTDHNPAWFQEFEVSFDRSSNIAIELRDKRVVGSSPLLQREALPSELKMGFHELKNGPATVRFACFPSTLH